MVLLSLLNRNSLFGIRRSKDKNAISPKKRQCHGLNLYSKKINKVRTMPTTKGRRLIHKQANP